MRYLATWCSQGSRLYSIQADSPQDEHSGRIVSLGNQDTPLHHVPVNEHIGEHIPEQAFYPLTAPYVCAHHGWDNGGRASSRAATFLITCRSWTLTQKGNIEGFRFLCLWTSSYMNLNSWNSKKWPPQLFKLAPKFSFAFSFLNKLKFRDVCRKQVPFWYFCNRLWIVVRAHLRWCPCARFQMQIFH